MGKVSPMKELIKTVYLDDKILLHCPGGMGEHGSCRYIEVYSLPEGMTRLEFKRFIYHNGRPAEGGRMYSTNEIGFINGDVQTAELSDEEIISKYAYLFDDPDELEHEGKADDKTEDKADENAGEEADETSDEETVEEAGDLTRESDEEAGKDDDSSGISYGLCIGAALGITYGLLFNNMMLGLAMGIGIGLCFGSAYDSSKKNKDNDNKE